jgi:Icc-related predicted phosphoesterase
MLLSCVNLAFSQEKSFIVLGDMHYDKFEYHDLDYVMTRPQDFKQIFTEYPQYTAFFLPRFMQLIRSQSDSITPKVKAVVQLGDLTEGVSGNYDLAVEMNRGVVDLINSYDFKVPWILAKGNHDVSNSPGQPEAWLKVMKPFVERQVRKQVSNGMYAYKMDDDIEFFVLDQFFSKDQNVPESAILQFLDTALKRSSAKHKFLVTHQPVVPVTQRCWHLFSGARRPVPDSTIREKFLSLIAKNKMIVLCGHLHEYSVLSRKTREGNIVQVMVNSVNRELGVASPKNLITQYEGEKWVEKDPDWQPADAKKRAEILRKERGNITTFKRADLPGYAVIKLQNNNVILEYFNGFTKTPYETINLTLLQ